MIDFVTKPDNEPIDPFEEYFANQITPLADNDNDIKRKYRSQFWTYFWSVSFLYLINVMIELFRHLMSGHKVNYEQQLIIGFVCILIIFIPIIKYYLHKKTDMFDVFIRFYGDFEHLKDCQVYDAHLPMAPKHNILRIYHNAMGYSQNVKVEIRDTDYVQETTYKKLKWRRVVGQGVRINLTMPEDFPAQIFLFDKSSSKRNVVPDGCQKFDLNIPASNYFSMCSTDVAYAKELLCSAFFEGLLDLQDVFRAKKIHAEIRNNTIKIFLVDSELYFDTYKFWSRQIDKERFRRLHRQFERTLSFTQTFINIINMIER